MFCLCSLYTEEGPHSNTVKNIEAVAESSGMLIQALCQYGVSDEPTPFRVEIVVDPNDGSHPVYIVDTINHEGKLVERHRIAEVEYIFPTESL